jgi:hypothetical protein
MNERVGWTSVGRKVNPPPHTDKKENKIFLIYREIQSGAVAKSYMRKGFLYMRECANISPYIRRPLVIYDFATACSHSEFPYI